MLHSFYMQVLSLCIKQMHEKRMVQSFTVITQKYFFKVSRIFFKEWNKKIFIEMIL